jgi:hypothetical protein
MEFTVCLLAQRNILWVPGTFSLVPNVCSITLSPTELCFLFNYRLGFVFIRGVSTPHIGVPM